MAHSQPALTTTGPPVTRAEWVWLAVAMVAGGILRLVNLDRVAVEHFDEVVYASNLLVPAEFGGEYPFRQLYAPPLLPSAIEWFTVFGKTLLGDVPRWWPMLPALACGLATIPSLWWIGRSWFSPRAGIVAALVIAFHEFHAAYSRTALTDVPLSLFVLWAVHWFWIALRSGRGRDAIVAGVFTSLAWWTKYNGWLPLAIAASGGVLWQILLPRGERNWTRLIRVWLLSAATAFVLWLPVLWDCQKIGGYSVVAANHRQYVTGLASWGGNLVRGYQYLDEFVGWTSGVGLLLAIAVVLLPKRYGVGEDDRDPTSPERLLASALTGAWFCGLIVATPLYFPYSRLWQPWLVSSCLVIAGGIPLPRLQRLRPFRSLGQWYLAVLCLAGVLCGLMLAVQAVSTTSPSGLPASLERRDSLASAADRIRTLIGTDDSVVVVAQSDPALWYTLRRSEIPTFLASTFEFVDGRLTGQGYLVIGPMSLDDPTVQADWNRRRDRFELVEEISVHPSRIALLDLVSPRELAEHPERRTMTVRLYRVRK